MPYFQEIYIYSREVIYTLLVSLPVEFISPGPVYGLDEHSHV